jgi:hypothetical protein
MNGPIGGAKHQMLDLPPNRYRPAITNHARAKCKKQMSATRKTCNRKHAISAANDKLPVPPVDRGPSRV